MNEESRVRKWGQATTATGQEDANPAGSIGGSGDDFRSSGGSGDDIRSSGGSGDDVLGPPSIDVPGLDR